METKTNLNHIEALMISIREETHNDIEPIRELTEHAFANSDFGHNGEADLVDAIRKNGTARLSLVASLEGKLVGHIFFSPVVIRSGDTEMNGMGLAPMSVAPRFQQTGIGSSLVFNGLHRLFDNQCDFVVVLGHASYYPRFGFRPAADKGISHGFADIPQDVFFIRANEQVDLDLVQGGTAIYQPQFGPQTSSFEI